MSMILIHQHCHSSKVPLMAQYFQSNYSHIFWMSREADNKHHDYDNWHSGNAIWLFDPMIITNWLSATPSLAKHIIYLLVAQHHTYSLWDQGSDSCEICKKIQQQWSQLALNKGRTSAWIQMEIPPEYRYITRKPQTWRFFFVHPVRFEMRGKWSLASVRFSEDGNKDGRSRD